MYVHKAHGVVPNSREGNTHHFLAAHPPATSLRTSHKIRLTSRVYQGPCWPSVPPASPLPLGLFPQAPPPLPGWALGSFSRFLLPPALEPCPAPACSSFPIAPQLPHSWTLFLQDSDLISFPGLHMSPRPLLSSRFPAFPLSPLASPTGRSAPLGLVQRLVYQSVTAKGTTWHL